MSDSAAQRLAFQRLWLIPLSPFHTLFSWMQKGQVQENMDWGPFQTSNGALTVEPALYAHESVKWRTKKGHGDQCWNASLHTADSLITSVSF